MTAGYADDRASALEDIRDAGAPVVFPAALLGTPKVYDALTDTWSGGSSPSDVTGSAIQKRSDPNRFAALGLVLIKPVTLLVAAAGLGVVPAPGMAMVWAGLAYTIKDVQTVAPDGVAILYTVTGSA